ncbi:MAG: hypothetical protein GQE15_36085 [Archangiaceae bacterium]|nr:hypothetical protein [Archangiaceae bacterium]
MTPKLLAVWAMTFVLSACCFRCAPEQKSYVDVPATLDAVKKRAKPPEVVVTVERNTRPTSGGGGCGHSAACVIILPFLLYSAVFPDKFDEVSVIENGVETFHGLYSTSGDLLSARAKTETGWRELVQLDLPELGQRAIVEAAKVTKNEDGGETKTPTTIQSQVDLVAQYREKLAKKEGKQRGALLGEAASNLSGEGDAFVLERLSAADEPDESRAAVVEHTCRHDDHPERAVAFIEAALKHPGGLTAKETLECELATDATITAAATMLAEQLCTVKHALDARALEPHGMVPEKAPLRSAGVKAGVGKCTKGGSVVARLTLYEPVSTDEWLEALAQPEAEVVVDLTTSAEREKIFAALERNVRTPQMLKLAKSARFDLTLKEANLLLDLAFKKPKDWEARASVAGALVNSRTLRPQLEPRLKQVAKDEQRTAQVFLAMLGDTALRNALADSLSATAAQNFTSTTINDEDELVIDAITEIGCKHHLLKAGKKAAACE